MSARMDICLRELRSLTERGRLQARRLGHPVLVGKTLAIAAPEDLVVALDRGCAEGREGVFWERPSRSEAFAGIGAAWQATAEGPGRFSDILAACRRVAGDAVLDTADAAPLFLCGFAFGDRVDARGVWREFPAARAVVPRLLIARRRQRATVTLATIVEPDGGEKLPVSRFEDELAWLERAFLASPVASSEAATTYEATPLPTQALWKQSVAEAIDDIRRGRFAKLVLARTCAIRSNRSFDCGRIVRRLRHAYPSCAVFWFAGDTASFVGATPEPLVRSSGQVAHVTAIAGSIARGTTTATDRALARALLNSEKDRHEHEVVVRAIRDSLAPLVSDLDIPAQPELLPLANVHHLLTTVTAHLDRSRHVLELVERLHPTPAIGGHPRETALGEIARRESIDRGWYAGAIGWMNFGGEGEFDVAIRSALVRDKEAMLYAGAGIVADSDPDAELAETRLKLQPLLAALMEI